MHRFLSSGHSISSSQKEFPFTSHFAKVYYICLSVSQYLYYVLNYFLHFLVIAFCADRTNWKNLRLVEVKYYFSNHHQPQTWLSQTGCIKCGFQRTHTGIVWSRNLHRYSFLKNVINSLKFPVDYPLPPLSGFSFRDEQLTYSHWRHPQLLDLCRRLVKAK